MWADSTPPSPAIESWLTSAGERLWLRRFRAAADSGPSGSTGDSSEKAGEIHQAGDQSVQPPKPRPDSSPRGTIVCLHGIISHSGWYHASCRRLAAAGWDVHFLDRRGSGLNTAARGDVDCWETWLADVSDYLDQLPRRGSRVLLGISWGGKLAAAVAMQRPWLVDRLVLLCPGLAAQVKARCLQRLALRVVRGTPLERRRVPIPLADPCLFTNEHQWQRFIANDPLTLRRATLRLAWNDLLLDRYVQNHAERVQAATLCQLSGKERIIDNQGVRRLLARFSGPEPRIIEYANAAHTLEFEHDLDVYLRDLISWLSGGDAVVD